MIFMNIKRIIFFAIMGLLFGLYESTAMTFLTPPFFYFHPLILIIVFLIITDRVRESYIFALAAGITRDFYSLEGSLFIFMELPLLVFALKFIAERVLTNQSLYSSLVLDSFARLFNWFWVAAIESLRSLFGSAPGFLLSDLFAVWPIFLFDVALLCLIFFFGNFVFKRFLAMRSFFKAPKAYG